MQAGLNSQRTVRRLLIVKNNVGSAKDMFTSQMKVQ